MRKKTYSNFQAGIKCEMKNSVKRPFIQDEKKSRLPLALWLHRIKYSIAWPVWKWRTTKLSNEIKIAKSSPIAHVR